MRSMAPSSAEIRRFSAVAFAGTVRRDLEDGDARAGPRTSRRSSGF